MTPVWVWGENNVPFGNRSDGYYSVYRNTDTIFISVKFFLGGSNDYSYSSTLPDYLQPMVTVESGIIFVASGNVSSYGRLILSGNTFSIDANTTGQVEAFTSFTYPAKTLAFN